MKVPDLYKFPALFFYFSLFLSYNLLTFGVENNSRIDWIGKLIKLYEIPRQASVLNGGPRPSG